ncbi:MAG: glycosyltransferase family 2 protein [Acidobacteria bacterium]|nr:glycosyltransferase family 2 protein [Acidobacteriota bacterium]MCA1643131.1 glycosyltransferase family 2 protein [Acidobacteriota bacterium]
MSTITNNTAGTQTTAGAVSQGRATARGQNDARPPVLAVVVPCFDEEEVVRSTAARLAALRERLIAAAKIDAASFVYFVDDGSRDGTWAAVEELHRADASIKGLKLARNVGMQNALLAGLLGVLGHADCAVTIDADLQQDERAIETFLDRYASGVHVVCGVRRSRSTDSWLKRMTASFFYNLMNLMGAKITKHHAEYRLLSSKALAALAEYRESNLFLRGIVADLGLRTENVAFDVRPREAGTTKHSPRKMIGLALDGITSFSVVPLRLVTAAGALIFLFSCVMMLIYLYQKYEGETLPGWAGTTIPIYFLGGVQIMFLGLVGEYVGKIYKEVKARPRYIRDEELF